MVAETSSSAGHVPDGEVDRTITWKLNPNDLRGLTQCHFFCWDSADGQKRFASPDGEIALSGPEVVRVSRFRARDGEKAMSINDTSGPLFTTLSPSANLQWSLGNKLQARMAGNGSAAVRADLERLGYACGGADMSAAGVGAPHVRQRLWWVADASGVGKFIKREKRELVRGNDSNGHCGEWRGNGRVNKSAWSDAEFILCDDGKTRPVEPGIAPLAHGVPKRVGKLRAYGNAIVSPLAAEFVAAFMECQDDQLA